MRFSSAIVAFVAFATSAIAQEATAGFDPITAPTSDQFLPAGSTFDITWSPSGASADATISITLMQGDGPSTLQLADVVAAGIPNTQGKYSWTVPASNFKTYGFKLTLDSAPTTFQYSNPFHITTSSSSSSVASTSSVASITSSSSSATATFKAAEVSTSANTTVASITSSALNTTSIILSTSAPTVLPASVNATSASVPYGNSTASATGASTVLTVVTPTPTKAAGSSAASTAAAATATAKSGAVAKVASGSFALVGGLLMAFAL